MTSSKSHVSSSINTSDDSQVDFVIGAPLEEELEAVLNHLPGHRREDPSHEDIHVYYSANIPVTLPSGTQGTYRVKALLLGKGQDDANLATGDAVRR